MQIPRPLILVPLLAAPAAAQSFNVDVGPNLILAPAPPSTYGAAAGQSGHWMEFTDPFTPRQLDGLSGAPASVTLESDSHGSFTVYPSVIPTPGDQELMEDAQWLPNLDVQVTWLFQGLTNGEYEVYTYAADPASDARSEIQVVGSSDAPQVVGGPWPGAHTLGVTYARHTVEVSDGSLTVLAMGWGAQPNNSGALNGFQLVSLTGGGPIGSSYCGPANLNSSGQAALVSAFGSDVVADDDVRLDAAQMATHQFGMFLNSMLPGFANPPGSQGNLCLGGGIGRYRANIMNTGSAGAFSLQLALTQTPTPGGNVAIQPGETWYFQAWFRDDNPGPTSNFTDGIFIPFQ